MLAVYKTEHFVKLREVYKEGKLAVYNKTEHFVKCTREANWQSMM